MKKQKPAKIHDLTDVGQTIAQMGSDLACSLARLAAFMQAAYDSRGGR